MIYAAGSADCSLSGTAMDDEGWVLLVRQVASDASGGVFPDAAAVLATNADMDGDAAKTAHLYSNLGTIERFRGPDGSFTLKLQWPDLSPIDHNIWKQSNVPQSEAPADYMPIEMQFASASSNIALAPSTSASSTLMDADEDTCWYSALGSYATYSNCGIPGPVCAQSDPLCAAVTGFCAGSGSQDAHAGCGWIADSRYFVVPTVELWVRAPMACIGNTMCSQPAPFICSEEFALISHIQILSASTDTDWSTDTVEGVATPTTDDPATSKFSDVQINSWVQKYGHENIVFKVVVNGHEGSARYYKFDAPSAIYASGLIDYTHVCASMHETVGFVCGAAHIWDSNQAWRGLGSVMNLGIQRPDAPNDDACLGQPGGDGFHGLANPNRVFDRCGGDQGTDTGTVDTYMKIRLE